MLFFRARVGVRFLVRFLSVTLSAFRTSVESGDASKLKQLEDENRKLKHVVAELTLGQPGAEDVLSKNF